MCFNVKIRFLHCQIERVPSTYIKHDADLLYCHADVTMIQIVHKEGVVPRFRQKTHDTVYY